MNIQQSGIITLVRSALTGEKLELPQGFDLEAAFKTANDHQIQVMLYYGAMNCGIQNNLPVMGQMFATVCQLIAINERQLYMLKTLMGEFDKNGIEYMPLKGTVLKGIYPKSELRTMSDSDILIHMEQYDKIREIMLSLGFKEGKQTGHELHWDHQSIHMELHKSLMPPFNNSDIFGYFDDCWEKANKKADGTSCCYEMRAEDQIVYLFTHLARHYRNGGVGIKHMTDMWVYQNSVSQLNKDYIKAELEKLKLYDFYVNVMHTVDIWFGKAENTQMSDFITQIIFDSGAYGKREGHLISNGVIETKKAGSSQKARFTKILFEIFLPYSKMCDRFEILKKVPVLLPIMWVVRWVDALIFRRKALSKKAETIKFVSLDKIDSYQKALDYVGLDFNFKE